VVDLPDVVADVAAGDDAVLMDALARHPLDGDDRPLVALEDVEQLAHAGRRRAADDVVAEEHTKRLLADEGAGARDGVAQAQRLLLPQVRDGRQLGDRLDLCQLLHLAAIVQVVLQLEGGVEVVLDRALAAAGDDDDLLQPRRHRLLDDVLDGRLVDEGQHLLGLGLGRGQEPRAETGRGEDAFADAHGSLPRSDADRGEMLTVERRLDPTSEVVLCVETAGGIHPDGEPTWITSPTATRPSKSRKMPVRRSRMSAWAPSPMTRPSTPAETTTACTSTPTSPRTSTSTTKASTQRATLVSSEPSVRERA